MGWFGNLFDESVAGKAVDAIIKTGDKLVYTEEEKAEMRLKTADMHIKMLSAYAPFKIAQRLIALLFIGGFLFTHLMAVFIFIWGNVELSKSLFKINNDVLGLPVSLIVGFYFMGGTLESYNKK